MPDTRAEPILARVWEGSSIRLALAVLRWRKSGTRDHCGFSYSTIRIWPTATCYIHRVEWCRVTILIVGFTSIRTREYLTTPASGSSTSRCNGSLQTMTTTIEVDDSMCAYLPQDTIVFDGANGVLETNVF